jgi:hypothetical protein
MMIEGDTKERLVRAEEGKKPTNFVTTVTNGEIGLVTV